MQKVYVFIILLLSCRFVCSAEDTITQEKYLKNKGKETVTPSAISRISQLYFDAYQLYNNNLPGVEKYADTIEQIVSQINFEKGYAYVNEIRAIALMNKAKFNDANRYFQKALDLYTKYKDTTNIANIHTNIGILYADMYLYDKCIQHYFEAVKLYSAQNDLQNVGRTYYNIANIYIRTGNDEKSLEVLLKAKKILLQANSEFGVAMVEMSLSNVYIGKGDYSKAWELVLNAEKIFKDKQNILPASMVGIYRDKGRIYEYRRENDKALKDYYKGYLLSKKLNLKDNLLTSADLYAKLLIKMNHTDSALTFLNMLDTSLQSTRFFNELKLVYTTYSNIYAKKGVYDSAYFYINKAAIMADSVYNIDMLNRLNQADVIFSIYEKDKYIKYLQQKKTIDELELQKIDLNFNILSIVSISIFIAFLLLIVFLIYRHRKTKEQLLLKEQITIAQSRLKQILDGTDQGIYGLDKDGLCTFINTAACQIIGFEHDECIGRNMHHLIHHHHSDGSYFPAEECLIYKRKNESFRIEGECFYKKDGSSFMAEYSYNPLFENDVLVGSVISFFDITERLKIKEAIADSERKYRILTDNSDDVIWTASLDGKLTYISPAIYYLLGYTPQEIMPLSLEQVIVKESFTRMEELFIAAMEEVNTGLKINSEPVEIEHIRKDGTKVWAEVVNKVMYDLDYNPIGIVGITRNINDKKIAQQEKELLLKQLKVTNETLEISLTQKGALIEELSNSKAELEKLNTEKDKFFSIIAHDLRSPFAGFLGLTEVLANDVNVFSKDELKDLSMNMKDSATNLYKLLDNLLQWSRMQRAQLEITKEEFVINLMIEQNIQLQSEVARQKNIKIENLLPDAVLVYADVAMLNTVIRNILSNSVKFTNIGGRIEIGVTHQTNNNMLCIYIQDNGIGMPDTIKNNLFKMDSKISRLGTNNEPSTGLGLMLCKEFITKNNGTITVESKEGLGSTFYIEIPSHRN
ncbi:MAG TPA: PAS domain S-box protein [Candidatus Kapabacteria bacterium]|nr:PAS domain S-box protein [Candidatus Kapabacteria bacterium]